MKARVHLLNLKRACAETREARDHRGGAPPRPQVPELRVLERYNRKSEHMIAQNSTTRICVCINFLYLEGVSKHEVLSPSFAVTLYD